MRLLQRNFRLALCLIAIALIAGCTAAGSDHDDHLFLATMADGAIIEFEPLTRP